LNRHSFSACFQVSLRYEIMSRWETARSSTFPARVVSAGIGVFAETNVPAIRPIALADPDASVSLEQAGRC
jgi:hypothetical protein